MNKISFFLFFFLFLNSFNLVKSENNIVILDLNYLFNNSNKGKQIQNELYFKILNQKVSKIFSRLLILQP